MFQSAADASSCSSLRKRNRLAASIEDARHGLCDQRLLIDRTTGATQQLTEGIVSAAETANLPIQVGCVGTMFGFYLLKEPGVQITDYATAKQFVHAERYATLFHQLLERGVYLAPSAFEAGFVSAAHTTEIIQSTLDAIQESMGEF